MKTGELDSLDAYYFIELNKKSNARNLVHYFFRIYKMI